MAVQQRALAEFAAVSQDAGSNYNSSRVTKAREKLAKLSFAQFRELSTDVYDELQRRISESPEQPAHLEPKSNLIPKRNEARQRLASLPSVRFGDLINDILFEIERRQEVEGLKPTAPEVHVSPSPPEPSLEGNQRGIFPQTVVPKKAALSWSSDEEEEQNEPERKSVVSSLRSEKLELETATRRDTWASSSEEETLPVLRNSINKTPVREVSGGREFFHRDQNNERTQFDQQQSHQTNGRQLNTERQSLERKNLEIQHSMKAPQLEDENHQLAMKSQEMQQKIQHLEQQLEQQENKHIQELERFKRAEEQLTDNLNGQRVKLQNAASERLKLENRMREIQHSVTSKDETIDKLEKACRSMENHHNDLRKEHSTLRSQVDSKTSNDDVTLWRTRCEKIRSEGIEGLLEKPQDKFSKVIGKKGMIPSKTVADFNSSLEMLLVSLQDPVDGPSFFELVGNVCSYASNIVSLVNLDEAANQVKLVNATLSHLVTASRYFVMYGVITSRAVVVTAANEVAFCLCDLLEIARLHEDDPVENAQPYTPVIDRFTPTQDVASPVRPLKMTQRLNSPEFKRRSDLESSRVRLKNGSGTPFQLKQRGTAGDGNATPFQLKEFSDESLPKGVALDEAEASPSRVKELKMLTPIKSEPKMLDLAKTDSVEGSVNSVKELIGRNRPAILGESKSEESKLSESSISKPGDSNLNQAPDSSSQPAESTLSKPISTAETSPAKSLSQQLSKPAEKLDKPADFSNKPAEKLIQPATENLPTAPPPTAPKEVPVESNIQRNHAAPTPRRSQESDENVSPIRRSRELDIPKRMSKPLESIPQRNHLRASREDLSQSPGKDIPRRLKPESNSGNFPEDSKRNRVSERLSKDSNHSTKVARNESNNRLRQSNGSSASASASASPRKSSPKSNQIMNRVKQFESAPPEPVKLQTVPKSLSSNSIEKFGERKRSSSNASNQQNNNNTTSDVAAEETRIAERDMRKSIDAANFNVEAFDILNPDNTLNELLLYLEHQTVAVISTIQTLLSSIKQQSVQRGVLKESAGAINFVIEQMTEATNNSMSQTRNAQLREHGRWVVESLVDCDKRMKALCNQKAADSELADKNFKQRLAGVSFDIARCTKELVKSVEEAAIKEEIAILDARMSGENLL